MTYTATIAFPSQNPVLARRMQEWHESPTVEVLPLPGHDSFFDAWDSALLAAHSDVLILTHEDVRIMSLPLIPSLVRGFTVHPELGVLGVAGAKEMDASEPWWFSRRRLDAGLLSGQIFHETGEGPQMSLYGPYGPVVVLDGVCLITTKDRLATVLPACRERTYAKWDFYDHVLSMEMGRAGYQLRTCPLQMIHDSKGGGKRESFEAAGEQFAADYL